MIVAPGAMPTMPIPLRDAAITPATCVPCSFDVTDASGFGSASQLPKSHPRQSSTWPSRSSSTPFPHVSARFTHRRPYISTAARSTPESTTATITPAALGDRPCPGGARVGVLDTEPAARLLGGAVVGEHPLLALARIGHRIGRGIGGVVEEHVVGDPVDPVDGGDVIAEPRWTPPPRRERRAAPTPRRARRSGARGGCAAAHRRRADRR